MYVS
jgi:ribonuclease HI